MQVVDNFARNHNLGNTSGRQTLRFDQPVTARSLPLVIKSEVRGNAFASVAELDVLVK